MEHAGLLHLRHLQLWVEIGLGVGVGHGDVGAAGEKLVGLEVFPKRLRDAGGVAGDEEEIWWGCGDGIGGVEGSWGAGVGAGSGVTHEGVVGLTDLGRRSWRGSHGCDWC